jgi:hypothetical protein
LQGIFCIGQGAEHPVTVKLQLATVRSRQLLKRSLVAGLCTDENVLRGV